MATGGKVRIIIGIIIGIIEGIIIGIKKGKIIIGIIIGIIIIGIIIGGWGGESFVTPTGKSFRFVRACERARRGEAVWASERRFDCVARAVVRPV